MHMADALLSPAVGGAMWAVTAGLTAYSAKKLKESPDDSRVPLMGVLGGSEMPKKTVFSGELVKRGTTK